MFLKFSRLESRSLLAVPCLLAVGMLGRAVCLRAGPQRRAGQSAVHLAAAGTGGGGGRRRRQKERPAAKRQSKRPTQGHIRLNQRLGRCRSPADVRPTHHMLRVDGPSCSDSRSALR